MKNTKLETGLKVNGSKGQGTIVKIITKSSGYVLVNYDGIEKKEMAFNLTDENGNSLRSNPNKKKSAKKLAEKLMVSSSNTPDWINEDGTTDFEKRNDFDDEREAAKWGSKSF